MYIFFQTMFWSSVFPFIYEYTQNGQRAYGISDTLTGNFNFATRIIIIVIIKTIIIVIVTVQVLP